MLDFAQVLENVSRPATARPVVTGAVEAADLDPHAAFRVKVVQVGIWEARRRLAAGQTDGLGMILANLDEDVELLRRSLEESATSA